MRDDDPGDLRTAEEFLDYFGIAYDPEVVAVNRVPLLRRFHDRIEAEGLPPIDEARKEAYALLLERAYRECQIPKTAPPPRPDDGGSVTFVPLSDVRM